MKVSFTDEYVKKDTRRFPKFRVEKMKDTDRIVIVSSPELYYVHEINMPVINPETGEKVMETKTSTKGGTFEVPKEEFVSTMLCTGDPTVVSGPDGIDPDGCKLCQAYVEHAGKFKRPTPKYAAIIAKYKTEFEETTPQLDPFVAEIYVWILTQKRFEKVINIAKEFGDPVGKLDLLCGPCKNVQMHNYEIAASGKCVYKESEEARDFINKSVAASGINEEIIKSTVANAQTEVSVKIALNKVLERYALEGHGATGGSAVDLEFNGAAVDSHKAAAAAESNPWGAVAESAPAASPDFVDKPADVPVQGAPTPAPAPAAVSETPTSLDDILAQLG